jgi:hypothetical protein
MSLALSDLLQLFLGCGCVLGIISSVKITFDRKNRLQTMGSYLFFFYLSVLTYSILFFVFKLDGLRLFEKRLINSISRASQIYTIWTTAILIAKEIFKFKNHKRKESNITTGKKP